MKRFLILALTLFFSLPSFAQEEHLKFKGISMKGNIGGFIEGLMDKGFDISTTTTTCVMMEGEFLGNPSTNVAVYPNPSTKNTAMVVAFVEAGYTWASLEKKYIDVVKLYSDRYGEPTQQDKYFDGDANTSFQKLRRIRESKCRYATSWIMRPGVITIMFLYSDGNYFVTCSYFDSANAAEERNIIDDI